MVLAYGFMRLKCGDCRSEQLVAFSCKKRGFCPSCGGKRMAETSTHLVEHIIPRVPIRQYVLSLPHPLRYWMASNKKLCGKVHKILATTVESFYCNKKNKKTRIRVTSISLFRQTKPDRRRQTQLTSSPRTQ